jgi:hypothetical protein
MCKVIAGLFLTIGCACLQAQGLNLRATIPFAFRAGETLMPAGEYTLRHANGVLVVRENGGHHSAAQLLTVGGSQGHAAERPNVGGSLEFHRYGARYFLSAISAPWPLDGVALPQSRSERALARRNQLPESLGIALKTP